jgi:hypothetical protein
MSMCIVTAVLDLSCRFLRICSFNTPLNAKAHLLAKAILITMSVLRFYVFLRQFLVRVERYRISMRNYFLNSHKDVLHYSWQ